MGYIENREQVPSTGCTYCGLHAGDDQKTLQDELIKVNNLWVCDECLIKVQRGELAESAKENTEIVEHLKDQPQTIFVNCSACGRQISAAAESCPACGHPLRTAENSKPSGMNVLSSLISALVMIGIIFYTIDAFISNPTNDAKQRNVELKPYIDKVTDPAQAPIPETDTRWFIIENLTGKCQPDEGPAEMISSLKKLGQSYKVIEDVVVDGKPYQVRLLLRDGVESGEIVYYRGKNRCEAQAKQKKQANVKELERYK